MKRKTNKEANKKYYESNKNRILESSKRRYVENKDEIIARNCAYAKDNRETRREYEQSYRQDNRKKINAVKSKYEKRKRQNNPSHKLRKNVSRLICFALAKKSSSKSNLSILKFLPYSILRLKECLEKQFESWMTWDNYGKHNIKTWNDNDTDTWTWRIDHIIPQSKLPYTSMNEENFQKCWSLNNLRPLSSKQNNLDGNRR